MKVPYLTAETIELRAQETRLAAIAAGVSDKFPFDAEATVEFLFEYDLHLGAALPKGMLGSTHADDKRVEISESITHEGRRRFTVAHEIGHIVLHVPLLVARSNETPLFDLEPAPAQDKSMEWQADTFASCFLMPRQVLVHRFGERVRQGDWVPVDEVATFFGVSKEAATIRLESVKLVLTTSPGTPLL
jgi:Zn-dependent peptidase ImmA (M78 family)